MITSIKKRDGRIVPFDQEKISDVCPVCGKPAKHMVYWGVAY